MTLLERGLDISVKRLCVCVCVCVEGRETTTTKVEEEEEEEEKRKRRCSERNYREVEDERKNVAP